MLKEYGLIFHITGTYLEQAAQGCKLLPKMKDDPRADTVVNGIRNSCRSVAIAAKDLGLKSSLALAERIAVETDPKKFVGLGEAVKELSSRINDELKNEWFLYIKADRLNFYVGKMLFGPLVDEKFPTTREDIEQAGKCLAVEQETASVFHIMRAVEAAVSALAEKLEIKNPDREWGKLLSDIHAKIEPMPKGAARDAWSECHANLYHVKQAWRNKTMHPKATYTSEQAKEVFAAAKAFMSQLATLI